MNWSNLLRVLSLIVRFSILLVIVACLEGNRDTGR